MVKVINISGKTIEIANVQIKPHTGYIFKEISLKDRQRLSAMDAVGIVKAYDGDYSSENKNTANIKINDNTNTIENKKPVKKSNKKK